MGSEASRHGCRSDREGFGRGCRVGIGDLQTGDRRRSVAILSDADLIGFDDRRRMVPDDVRAAIVVGDDAKPAGS